MIACPNKECGYKRPVAEPGEAEPDARPMPLSGGLESPAAAAESP